MVRGVRIVRTERIICNMNRMVSWISLKMRRLSKTWKELKALFKWISGVGSFQAERATIGNVPRMVCPIMSRNSGRLQGWGIMSALDCNSRRSETMQALKIIANNLAFTLKLGVTKQY